MLLLLPTSYLSFHKWSTAPFFLTPLNDKYAQTRLVLSNRGRVEVES